MGRIRLLSVILGLVTALYIGRLFFLQIILGKTYAEHANQQYARQTADVWNRGDIILRQKDGTPLLAATVKTRYVVSVDPKLLADASGTYAKLNAVFPMDETSFLQKATKPNDSYEILAKTFDEGIAQKVAALGITGLDVTRENVRSYPAGRLASHVLGYISQVKEEGTRVAGRYGVEKEYDNVLNRASEGLYVNFFAELFSDIGKNITQDPNVLKEGDVELTIAPEAQQALEQEVKATQEKWHAQGAGGIVMDPTSGAIVAMAATPDFDPNAYSKETDLGVFPNPLVERVYEMGSIVKALTMASGLDAGVVTASTTYNDKGYVILNKKRIENYDGKGRGVIPMQEVLNESLNTGAVFVMQQLGKDRFRQKFLDFGLGGKTGIDLPDEAAPLIHNFTSTRDIEYATAAFGQGIAVSPIAIVRALGALANDGMLVTPHVLKSIDERTGISVPWIAPTAPRRMISEAAAKEITRMLTRVVDTTLANGKVRLATHSIAAKTGTAQIAKPGGGGYYSDRYFHTFFGYFPATAPRYLIFLFLNQPQNVRYASETLTDPFVHMVSFLIHYFDVPPDR